MKSVLHWTTCSYVTVLLTFVATVIKLGFAQQTSGDGCFTTFDNMQVQCVKPFQSKTGATEQQCKDMCLQNMPQCQGAQYQPSTMQCDLYNTMPTTGRKKRGGQRMYSGGGGGQQQYVQQTQPPYQPQPQPYKPVQPQPGTYQKPGGCGGGYGPSVSNVGGSTYYKPTGQTGCCSTCSLQGGSSVDPPVTIPVTTVPPPVTTPVLPPQATCGAGQVVRYLEVKGYQLSGNPDQQFNAANEQECVQSCTNNRMPSGNVAACQTADFSTSNNQCSFMLNASPPTGTGTLTQNPSMNHYEKVCLDSATGQVCPGPIIKAPQKLVVGFAESVVTSSSFADCLQNCVNAQTRFNFKCLSGEFYSSEATDNCILNSESATTQPALYTDETRDKVDYFEPGCVTTTRDKRDIENLKPRRQRNVIWINKDSWGSWTRCDGVFQNHKRFRQCSSFNPNKCQKDQIKCDPSKRAMELGAINDEEQSHANTAEVQESHSVGPVQSATTTGSPSIDGVNIISVTQVVNRDVQEVVLPTRRHHLPDKHDGNEDSPSDKESESKNNSTQHCDPVVKLDGTPDCKHGFRTLANGRKVACKPRMVNDSC